MKRMLLLAALLLVGGCAGRYYRVTDTSSGRVYYTRDVDTKRRSGAVDFKDGKSGAKVTLQSSQVEKISEAQYQQGLASK
ncbi:MAG TPA: hypothetical protein VFY93_08145 [Planctomycetota bacterium]|nr:hypothetical protein [Planctomycetota bacterium]